MHGSTTVHALACAALIAAFASGCSTNGAPGGAPDSGFVFQNGAPADPPTRGMIVARVEHEVPALSSYVVRATLPVPPGTFPRPDGKSPFAIKAPGRPHVPAQTEIVSRYPSPGDGADVVEVLARVERPDGVSTGERIRYDVIWEENPSGSLEPDPQVTGLLTGAADLVLRTRDVFGHEYAADLYEDVRRSGESARVLRHGRAARQHATHETLLPVEVVSGPTGTLPHHVGVHAYVTEWSGEPFVSLDLRIHNAHSGLDQADPSDDPLGKVYFDALELVVPQGWVVLHAFDDPCVGAPYAEDGHVVYPIVRALDDGTLNVMPPMSQMPRRLAVCRAGQEARAQAYLAEQNLAFVVEGHNPQNRELWSWWNAQTARYFPQRHRLPSLEHVGLDGLRTQLSSEFHTRANQLAGTAPITWPIVGERVGWAHPWGTTHGSMVSGSEIYLWDGVETAAAQSTQGYRLFEVSHRMYTERQPNVLFNRDGRHTRMPQWITTQNGQTVLPIWWYNEPMLWASDPFGFSQAPTFQVQAVEALGRKPAYEAGLLSYEPIDEMHLIRYTRSPKVLAWLGNDALAKDDLRSQAEGIRFTYSMVQQDGWGGIIPTGMLAARNYVDRHPAQGFIYGRSEGWGIDVMCAAYSTQDEAWRDEVRGWFHDTLDLVEDGASSCMGNIQSSPLGNIFDAQYRCRQSIEQAIVENALVSLRESVFGAGDPPRAQRVNAVLRRTLYGMLHPVVWSSSLHGPWAMIATGPIDMELPPYCSWSPSDGNYGIIDGYQTWSSFAYGYELTGDGVFLNKAAEMLQADLVSGLHQQGLTYLQNRVALLALVQDLY